jgi:Alkylmercury lyase
LITGGVVFYLGWLQTMHDSWATPATRRVRHQIFSVFAAEGRAPSPDELAVACDLAPEHVLEALRELHEKHAIVLTDAGDSIRMAHPFSAWPMGFALREGDRFWWGGCAWDSFGIMAALDRPLEVTTTCPGCGATLRYSTPPDAPPELVVRIPRPARDWWDDVVDTCTHIRTFCSAEHVTEQSGQIVELERLYRLALPWYGDRLDPGWAPKPRDERQAILGAVGLTGPFWELPG